MRGLTPLIDLLFLLLFGLLALSETRTAMTAETVRVSLPRVEPQLGTDTPVQQRIMIEIDHLSQVRVEGTGAPILDGASLDRALGPHLGDALPEQWVVEIHGDAAARHGVAVGLLQHLRSRGFASVHLLALGAEDAGWSVEEK
jgi:biopolymer transport protein ExbD